MVTRPIVHPTRTLSLDLVSELWYLDDEGLAALWVRARSRPLGQLTVKQLASDDLLLYLTAYAVVHRGHLGPSFFTDLRVADRERNRSIGPTLVEEANRRHLKIPLYHGLYQLALSNSTTEIPSTVIQQLAPTTMTEKTLEFLFPTIGDNPASSRTRTFFIVDYATAGVQACLALPHPLPINDLSGLSVRG